MVFNSSSVLYLVSYSLLNILLMSHSLSNNLSNNTSIGVGNRWVLVKTSAPKSMCTQIWFNDKLEIKHHATF